MGSAGGRARHGLLTPRTELPHPAWPPQEGRSTRHLWRSHRPAQSFNFCSYKMRSAQVPWFWDSPLSPEPTHVIQRQSRCDFLEKVPSDPVPESLSQVLQLLPVCACVHYTLSLCWCFLDGALISPWGKAGSGEATILGRALGLSSPKSRPFSRCVPAEGRCQPCSRSAWAHTGWVEPHSVLGRFPRCWCLCGGRRKKRLCLVGEPDCPRVPG